MRCLDEREVALFFAGRLGEEEIAALEAHIDECAACLALVTAVAPAFGPSGERSEPAGGKRKAGEVIAGRYEIQELLGAGATGSVYRARDNLVDTVVALKVLHPHFAEQPAWVRTFKEELQLTRRLIHPNVCRVFDMQQSEGVSFLTMEWAPGGSLADSIRRTQDSALSDRVRDGVALANGVAAMHAAGLIHRDIKPANVLRGEGGRIMLSDLGLALPLAEVQRPGKVVGTPSYMAPEVVAGEPATRRSDVWSLGVTLHEVFFGHKLPGEALTGSSRLETGAHRGLELALARLCRDCLNREPRLRPVDGGAVLQHLQDIEQRLHPLRRTARQLGKILKDRARVVSGVGMATVIVTVIALSLPRRLVSVDELVPRLSFAPPKNTGGAAAADEGAVLQGLEFLRSRLSTSSNIKLVQNPPRNPTANDWKLEVAYGRTPAQVTCETTVTSALGESRLFVRSATPFLVELAKWTRTMPCKLDSELAFNLESLAVEQIRRSWVEQGTESDAARTAMLSLEDGARSTEAVLRVVKLALDQDPGYLAAHVEQAMLVARHGAELSGNPGREVEAHNLRKHDEDLARRAPSDPRVLSARCRLRQLAFELSPQPTDSDLEEAFAVCRKADQSVASGVEPLVWLARLSAQSCDPSAAYESLQRAINRPGTAVHQSEVFNEWARLALRQQWNHSNVIESHPSGRTAVARSLSSRSSRLPFLLGALKLRDGTKRESRRWLEEAWRGRQDGAQFWAVAEGLVSTADEQLALRIPAPVLQNLLQPTKERLSAWVAQVPRDGARVAEELSWISPSEAQLLLKSLPPASRCTDSLARARLRHSLGVSTGDEARLPLCQSGAKWIDRCRAWLRRNLGSDDPLRPSPDGRPGSRAPVQP